MASKGGRWVTLGRGMGKYKGDRVFVPASKQSHAPAAPKAPLSSAGVKSGLATGRHTPERQYRAASLKLSRDFDAGRKSPDSLYYKRIALEPKIGSIQAHEVGGAAAERVFSGSIRRENRRDRRRGR